MRGSWVRLAVGIVVLALALAVARRLPRHAPPPPAPEPPAVVDTLEVAIGEAGVTPADAGFALGHRLELTLRNTGAVAHRVSLAGYESQFPEAELPPGASRTATPALDLPGEDFAWRVDGTPVGRFSVRGSHLVAGHR